MTSNSFYLGKKPYIPFAKIKAVRGHLTRKLLGADENTAVGDPAILVPLYYKIQTEKKYKLGIVPHYVDKGNLLINRLNSKYKEVKIIDVHSSIENVINEISLCEYVISSSLHGLIVPEALRIKSAWIELSDRVIGEGYKFRDYYSAFGLDNIDSMRLAAKDSLEDVLIKINSRNFIQDTINKKIKDVQEKLIKSFPF